MSKAKVKTFLENHKWELLAALLLMAGTGTVTYRIAYKRGARGSLVDMLAAVYRDNQQLALYVDELTESWTRENRLKLAKRGAEVLKEIEKGLS